MQRIAAGEGDPLALNARVVEIGDDPILHLLRERQAGVQPPGAFVVAAWALMHAAGDEQGAAGAGAVDDVDRVVLVVIHFRFPLAAITVLAALTHPGHLLL